MLRSDSPRSDSSFKTVPLSPSLSPKGPQPKGPQPKGTSLKKVIDTTISYLMPTVDDPTEADYKIYDQKINSLKVDIETNPKLQLEILRVMLNPLEIEENRLTQSLKEISGFSPEHSKSFIKVLKDRKTHTNYWTDKMVGKYFTKSFEKDLNLLGFKTDIDNIKLYRSVLMNEIGQQEQIINMIRMKDNLDLRFILIGFKFNNLNCSGLCWHNANLSEVEFTNCNHNGSKFIKCNLTKTSFIGENKGCEFNSCYCEKTNFGHSPLNGSTFKGSSATDLKIKGSVLGCDFSGIKASFAFEDEDTLKNILENIQLTVGLIITEKHLEMINTIRSERSDSSIASSAIPTPTSVGSRRSPSSGY
jgi:hypothetical protein